MAMAVTVAVAPQAAIIWCHMTLCKTMTSCDVISRKVVIINGGQNHWSHFWECSGSRSSHCFQAGEATVTHSGNSGKISGRDWTICNFTPADAVSIQAEGTPVASQLKKQLEHTCAQSGSCGNFTWAAAVKMGPAAALTARMLQLLPVSGSYWSAHVLPAVAGVHLKMVQRVNTLAC